MSGRTPVLRDGEWIKGYRKTDRRNPRREPDPFAPPRSYRLIFLWPKDVARLYAEGAHGWAIEVNGLGNVTVKTADKDLTMRKAAEFVQDICKGQKFVSIGATMQAPSSNDVVQIAYVNGNVLTWYGSAKPTFFPAKR